MRAFAELLDRLAFTHSRNAKLVLVRDYLKTAPDPDRGWALAALTGELSFHAAKPAMIRRAVEARVDPVLFGWSYDYVGDLAETAALIWPDRRNWGHTPAGRGAASMEAPDLGVCPQFPWPADPARRPNREPSLSEVVEALLRAGRTEAPGLIEDWLDALDAAGRWALLKLVTGGLRIGLSARLAKTAAAMIRPAFAPVPARPGEPAEQGPPLPPVDVAEIEELWRSLAPPYSDLFAWLEGRSERPSADTPGRFRPVMLAQALDEACDFERLPPKDYAAEWKWDGVRVQAVIEGGERRLYSRTGDEISRTFPDLMAALDFEGVIDGELLVIRDGEVAPFGDLQQRLNRKTADAKLMAAFPAAIRAYDLLADGPADLRPLPFAERRRRLEAFVEGVDGSLSQPYAKNASAKLRRARLDLSPLVPFESWDQLARLRADPPVGAAAEGLMLKRWDSPYEAGRPKGPWFKWKRDPYRIDAVLMYAQRGHGKRSSFYSDYTFGVWTEDGGLAPVGKAYFGFTDEELRQIDQFVRDHTVERFGPVRAVRADHDFGLVFEIAFEGLQRSTRHKSGLAMRFPRIGRIRWDKPAREADTLETVTALLDRIEAGGGRV